MPLTINDLNWISIGFRLGQLTDACNREYADDDDHELVGSLIANLALAASICVPAPGQQALVRNSINEVAMNWENRDSLAFEFGTAKPFDLIYGACLRLLSTVRRMAKSARNVTDFEVGVLLGQSSGWCGTFFDGRNAAETCWCYRDRPHLRLKLAELGVTLESLSGILDTESPKKLLKFMSKLAPDSEKMKRYPLRRWGWAFIEDQLVHLGIELESSSRQEGNGKQPDDKPQTHHEEMNGEIPAKYLYPLSPLERDIVKVLWTCRYGATYEKLEETAWEGEKRSNSAITRRLRDINTRWKAEGNLDVTIQVSARSERATLTRPKSNAAGNV